MIKAFEYSTWSSAVIVNDDSVHSLAALMETCSVTYFLDGLFSRCIDTRRTHRHVSTAYSSCRAYVSIALLLS